MAAHDYLLLRLDGPMAAFGGPAVDNLGVTRSFPAGSMLTGLLANALGFQRHHSEALQRLQSRLRYAVRLEQPANGRVWRDFQSAQLGAGDSAWTTAGRVGRAGGAKTYTGPHLRYRDYLHDLRAALALRLSDDPRGPSQADCAAALAHPARPLFIGRKACLPSGPILRARTRADSALRALRDCAPALSPRERRAVQALPCLWLPGEGDEQLAAVPALECCDERDWANSQHTGQRRLYRADIPLSWFESD